MRFRVLLLTMVWPAIGFAIAGDLPAWSLEELPDKGALTRPGVYPLPDSRLLGVGQGKVRLNLGEMRSRRIALTAAERDAKRRIAKYLHPGVFDKYKTVAVELRRSQRVFEQAAGQGEEAAYVGIVVSPADVSITPIPDASIILDAERVAVSGEMLAYLEDPLLQTGGARIFAYNDGWLIMAVGLAPMFGTDSTAEHDARKRARIAAGKAMTETVFGSDFEVLEREAETRRERDGIARVRQWSRTETRESIKGYLKRAGEVGHWFTDDAHVAVALAASDRDLGANATEFFPSVAENGAFSVFPEWQVEPQWERLLAEYPHLLKGGAVLYSDGDGMWVVGVGAAKLTGDAVKDRMDAPRVAEIDAKRNIVQFLIGFSSQSESTSIEDLEIVGAGADGKEKAAIVESLRSMTREKANGLIRGLHRGGTWKSEDEKTFLSDWHCGNPKR